MVTSLGLGAFGVYWVSGGMIVWEVVIGSISMLFKN